MYTQLSKSLQKFRRADLNFLRTVKTKRKGFTQLIETKQEGMFNLLDANQLLFQRAWEINTHEGYAN